MAARCRSNSARCSSVKNSWFANLGERCRGVSVSSVQIPCRSGSPQGVVSAGAGAAAEVTGLRHPFAKRVDESGTAPGATTGKISGGGDTDHQKYQALHEAS